MNFKLTAYALQDIGRRDNQEDCFFPPFIDPCHIDETKREWSFYDGTPHTDDRLFMVCDGMGGHDRGEVASRIVTWEMSRALLFSAPVDGPCPDSLIEDAVRQAYEALMAEYDSEEERKMGTTMTLLKFHSEGATVCHIGDSRVYQFRSGGEVAFRTKDHAQGHMLLRCMMAEKGYRPQVDFDHIQDIRRGDVFLLCSDGVLENLSDEDLAKLVCDPNYSGAQKAQRLLERTIDNRDNHTAIIVRVDDVNEDVNEADSVLSKESQHAGVDVGRRHGEALPAGAVLNGKNYAYHVEKVLGHGAFGVTYLVNTSVSLQGQLGTVHTDVKLAMKEYFMHSGGEDKVEVFAQKFQREARKLAMLSHPNIVKVLEVFEANGTYYYTMEYLPQGSLFEYIKEHGAMSERQALGVIRQIGFALTYLHQNMMLHLDIKPSNIMLTDAKDMTVKIIDFGLAKHYEEDGKAESSAMLGAGTSGYAPLEQTNSTEEQAFSPQLDVYALAATYYKMLTGLTPNPAVDVLNNGLNTLPLTKRRVSNRSIEAITAGMQPTTKLRLKTVQEFLDMLPSVDDEELQHQKKKEGGFMSWLKRIF